jgi:hypothetical protein
MSSPCSCPVISSQFHFFLLFPTSLEKKVERPGQKREKPKYWIQNAKTKRLRSKVKLTRPAFEAVNEINFARLNASLGHVWQSFLSTLAFLFWRSLRRFFSGRAFQFSFLVLEIKEKNDLEK